MPTSKKSEGCAKALITIGIPGIVIALLVGFLFILVGPKGCQNKIRSWSSSAYGSDWLVVQYAYDGTVIASWELNNKAVDNETNSDGIRFIDKNSNVVHLSGHYVYIEVREKRWEEARTKLLPKAPPKE